MRLDKMIERARITKAEMGVVTEANTNQDRIRQTAIQTTEIRVLEFSSSLQTRKLAWGPSPTIKSGVIREEEKTIMEGEQRPGAAGRETTTEESATRTNTLTTAKIIAERGH